MNHGDQVTDVLSLPIWFTDPVSNGSAIGRIFGQTVVYIDGEWYYQVEE